MSEWVVGRVSVWVSEWKCVREWVKEWVSKIFLYTQYSISETYKTVEVMLVNTQIHTFLTQTIYRLKISMYPKKNTARINLKMWMCRNNYLKYNTTKCINISYSLEAIIFIIFAIVITIIVIIISVITGTVASITVVITTWKVFTKWSFKSMGK